MAYSAWGSSHIGSSSRPDKVLLIYPPAYDTRLPWAKWQHPSLLLRLATLLRSLGSDVRLIDYLSLSSGQNQPPRKKINTLDVDSNRVPRWRFGTPAATVSQQFKEFIASHWQPDVIYVECGTTYWWQGAHEAITLARQSFPAAHIVLIGTYPQYARQHAIECAGADEVPSEAWPELKELPADLSLYTTGPQYAQILLGDGKREKDAIVQEITAAITHGVRYIAFSEHRAASLHPELFARVLEGLIGAKIKPKLHALGSVTPADMVRFPELPALMRRAGYIQICFADDRDTPDEGEARENLIADYADAAALCWEAGFRPRTDEVIGSVCVGQADEDLAERAKVITQVAHYAGSIIVWPYQPYPDECGEIPLEEQIGKLFPLRYHRNHSYRDYLNLLGLATVCNSKYRARTFDFLGDSLTARLFQESVARQGWNPDPSVKGTTRLPMVAR